MERDTQIETEKMEIERERDNDRAEKIWGKQERNKQDNHIAMIIEYSEINIYSRTYVPDRVCGGQVVCGDRRSG